MLTECVEDASHGLQLLPASVRRVATHSLARVSRKESEGSARGPALRPALRQAEGFQVDHVRRFGRGLRNGKRPPRKKGWGARCGGQLGSGAEWTGHAARCRAKATWERDRAGQATLDRQEEEAGRPRGGLEGAQGPGRGCEHSGRAGAVSCLCLGWTQVRRKERVEGLGPRAVSWPESPEALPSGPRVSLGSVSEMPSAVQGADGRRCSPSREKARSSVLCLFFSLVAICSLLINTQE